MSEDIDQDLGEFENLDKEGQKDVIERVLEKYEKQIEETDDPDVKRKIELKKSILKKMKENLG